MSSWFNLGLNDKKVVLQQTAEKEGIPELAIEKDCWVTIVLKALFSCSCNDFLLFKGGTSLSKGWGLIQRFSEDIDIALDKSFFEIDAENKSQIDKLKKKSRKYIKENLMPELKQKLIEQGVDGFDIEFIETTDSDVDPSVINIIYSSIFESTMNYIKNIVKIEISCLSLSDPNQTIKISSIVNKYYPDFDTDSCCNIKTVLPARTFLEKIFLLHEEFQKDNPRCERMSRHLYDLEKLMDVTEVIDSLNNKELYNTIVSHREKFYSLKYVDYSKHSPELINIIPNENIYKKWEDDYSEMKKTFIYGDSLSFDRLIARINELQDRIHNLKNK